jgi:hypothetical protein
MTLHSEPGDVRRVLAGSRRVGLATTDRLRSVLLDSMLRRRPSTRRRHFHWHIKPGPWLLALLAGLAFYALVTWGVWSLTHPERPAVPAVTPSMPAVGHKP